MERGCGANDQDPTRGTVDGARFRLWVEERLCPILGNYSRVEARSIVLMDNASNHYVEDIQELIESTGAKLIYTALSSLGQNPIENMLYSMFHIYEMSLLESCTGAGHMSCVVFS